MAKYMVYLLNPVVGGAARGIVLAGTIEGVLDSPLFVNNYNASPELKQILNMSPRENFVCTYIMIDQVSRYKWALEKCRELLFEMGGWQLDEYAQKRIVQKVNEPITPEELSRVQ